MEKVGMKSELLKEIKRPSKKKKKHSKKKNKMSDKFFLKINKSNKKNSPDRKQDKFASESKHSDYKSKSFQKTIKRIDQILNKNSNQKEIDSEKKKKKKKGKFGSEKIYKIYKKRISNLEKSKPSFKELSKKIYPQTGRIKTLSEKIGKFSYLSLVKKKRKMSYEGGKDTTQTIDEGGSEPNYVKIKNFVWKKNSKQKIVNESNFKKKKRGKSFDTSHKRKRSVGNFNFSKISKDFDLKDSKAFKTLNYRELAKNIETKLNQSKKIDDEKNKEKIGNGVKLNEDENKIPIKSVLEKLTDGKKTHRKIYSTHNFENYLKKNENDEIKKIAKNKTHRRQKSTLNFNEVNPLMLFKSENFSSAMKNNENFQKKKFEDFQPPTTKKRVKRHQRVVSMNFFSSENLNFDKLKKDIEKTVQEQEKNTNNITQTIKPAKISKGKNGPIFSYSVNKYNSKQSQIDENHVALHFNNTKIPIEGFNGKLAKMTYCFFGLYEGNHGNYCANFFKQHFHKTLFKSPYILTNVVKAIRLTLIKLQDRYFKAKMKIGISSRTTSSASIFFTLGQKGYSVIIGNCSIYMSLNNGRVVKEIKSGQISQNLILLGDSGNKNQLLPPVDIQTFDLESDIDFVLIPSKEIRVNFESMETVKSSWKCIKKERNSGVSNHELMGKIINKIISKNKIVSENSSCTVIGLSLKHLTRTSNPKKKRRGKSEKKQKQFKSTFKRAMEKGYTPVVSNKKKYMMHFKKKSYSERKKNEIFKSKFNDIYSERRRRNLTIDVNPMTLAMKMGLSPELEKSLKENSSMKKRIKKSNKRAYSDIHDFLKKSKSNSDVYTNLGDDQFEKIMSELKHREKKLGKKKQEKLMNDHVLIVDEGEEY